MFRFIMPVILIGIAITGFFTFTSPMYQEINGKRAEAASYDEALGNSKALESERDKLTKKYNAISKENLDRLMKMLPENVDNIRLILEIEKLAAPYGMLLRDVKYDTEVKDVAAKPTPASVAITNTPSAAPSSRKDYGTWELQFSTTGTYTNFLNFLNSLERNLRMVDIVSIRFSSVDSPVGVSSGGASLSQGSASTPYKYEFRIKTYWLKN